MKLSAKARYATRIMTRLARVHGDSSWRTSEIAAAEKISADYVAQILISLKRAGLVDSQRGMQGGFTLARSASEISVADVIEAAEGPLSLAPCSSKRQDCERASLCVTQSVWSGAAEVLRNYFMAISVEQLARKSVEKEQATTPMFEI